MTFSVFGWLGGVTNVLYGLGVGSRMYLRVDLHRWGQGSTSMTGSNDSQSRAKLAMGVCLLVRRLFIGLRNR